MSKQCCATQPRYGQKHQLTEEHHSIPSPVLHTRDRGGAPTEGQRWATMFHSSAAPGAHSGSPTQAGAGSTTALSPRDTAVFGGDSRGHGTEEKEHTK